MAGFITYYGTKPVERCIPIDDPVGASRPIGFNGIVGIAML
ncbi:MAG: hypothetical protein LM577_03820 [Thermoproteaceae archaeon]|nr:hypothetical protein [Thermoproteaceae archaeon]